VKGGKDMNSSDVQRDGYAEKKETSRIPPVSMAPAGGWTPAGGGGGAPVSIAPGGGRTVI
jgi:hypothetical protein